MAEITFFNLEGGCMRPLLQNGEILPVRAIEAGAASIGDVVLYRIGAKKMLHRIWWMDRRGVWIKDDTGTVDIHRIPRRFVLGILEARRPLSRGVLGLLYALLNTAFFIAARSVSK